MPYIKQEGRPEIDGPIADMIFHINSKGDVNYAICELIGRLILKKGVSYTQMSELIDVLPDAEDELRRRILHIYENKMITKNGDVPSFTQILKIIEEK